MTAGAYRISRAALQAFDEHRGDVDRFAAATGALPDLQAWTLMNVLAGDMILLRKGHAAPHFAKRLQASLAAAVEGDEVLELLRAIADRKIAANDLKG